MGIGFVERGVSEALCRGWGFIILFEFVEWLLAINHVSISIRQGNIAGTNMLSEEMIDALNKQLHGEINSAYLYLSMSSKCEEFSLSGFAQWLKHQSEEELQHAMRLYQFLVDRDISIILEDITPPKADFKSQKEIMEHYLQLEINGLKKVQDLGKMAREQNLQEVEPLIHWYINVHIQEEKVGRQIYQQLKMAGDDGAALLMLDRELANRAISGSVFNLDANAV